MSVEAAYDLAALTDFPIEGIEWIRLRGGPGFEYPVDYSIAVLGACALRGQVDFLSKWEPDSYCHYHRHLGQTTAVVLEGEHHVVEESPTEVVHKTRKPGHSVRNPSGDVHMEYSGPHGSVVFFSMTTPDGRVFDILDRQGDILVTVTLDDMASGRLPV